MADSVKKIDLMSDSEEDESFTSSQDMTTQDPNYEKFQQKLKDLQDSPEGQKILNIEGVKRFQLEESEVIMRGVVLRVELYLVVIVDPASFHNRELIPPEVQGIKTLVEQESILDVSELDSEYVEFSEGESEGDAEDSSSSSSSSSGSDSETSHSSDKMEQVPKQEHQDKIEFLNFSKNKLESAPTSSIDIRDELRKLKLSKTKKKDPKKTSDPLKKQNNNKN